MAHGLNWGRLGQTLAMEAGGESARPVGKIEMTEICGFSGFSELVWTVAQLGQTGANWGRQDGLPQCTSYPPKGGLTGAGLGPLSQLATDWGTTSTDAFVRRMEAFNARKAVA